MVKLSTLLQNAGNPKVFFLNHEESGKKIIYVNIPWLVENFADSVFFEESVDRIWGYFTPDGIGEFIENDTSDLKVKYKGYSAEHKEYLDEMLEELESYKNLQSLKIEVLIP